MRDELEEKAGPVEWTWENLGERLLSDLSQASEDVLIVAPYITQEPLARLMNLVDEEPAVTVITCLNPEAIVRGALSTHALRLVLGSRMGAVRHVKQLHAKIYVADWHVAWIGSANFTVRGLGFGPGGNVEILGRQNRQLGAVGRVVAGIMAKSRPVAVEEIESLETLAEEWAAIPSDALASLEWSPPHENDLASKGYLLASLPTASSPQSLLRGEADGRSQDHDRFLLGLTGREDELRLRAKCASYFAALPMMNELDVFLSTPRRFGEFTAWLHGRVEDRPVPYRSDIKELAARLQTWMTFAQPERYRSARPAHTQWFGLKDGEWPEWLL